MGTDAADQPLIACDRPASLLGSQLVALLAAQGASRLLISLTHTDALAQAFAVLVR